MQDGHQAVNATMAKETGRQAVPHQPGQGVSAPRGRPGDARCVCLAAVLPEPTPSWWRVVGGSNSLAHLCCFKSAESGMPPRIHSKSTLQLGRDLRDSLKLILGTRAQTHQSCQGHGAPGGGGWQSGGSVPVGSCSCSLDFRHIVTCWAHYFVPSDSEPLGLIASPRSRGRKCRKVHPPRASSFLRTLPSCLCGRRAVGVVIYRSLPSPSKC